MCVGSTKISLSLYEPVALLDVIDGQTFAVLSDGTFQTEALEWPVRNVCFEVDAATVITVQLFTAQDELQFLQMRMQGNMRPFAEVHLPARLLMQRHGGCIKSGWLGLQRSRLFTGIDVNVAVELYDVGLLLAQNLLAPKLCFDLVELQSAGDAPPAVEQCSTTCGGEEEDNNPWRRSLVQHRNMIRHLHHQLRALWRERQLQYSELPNGNLILQVTEDVERPVPPPSPQKGAWDSVLIDDSEEGSDHLNEGYIADSHLYPPVPASQDAQFEKVAETGGFSQKALPQPLELWELEDMLKRNDRSGAEDRLQSLYNEMRTASVELRRRSGEVASLREALGRLLLQPPSNGDPLGEGSNGRHTEKHGTTPQCADSAALLAELAMPRTAEFLEEELREARRAQQQVEQQLAAEKALPEAREQFAAEMEALEERLKQSLLDKEEALAEARQASAAKERSSSPIADQLSEQASSRQADCAGEPVESTMQLRLEVQELLLRESTSRAREEKLKSELAELQDQNEQLVTQSQKQLDEFSKIQERTAAEIAGFCAQQAAEERLVTDSAAVSPISQATALPHRRQAPGQRGGQQRSKSPPGRPLIQSRAFR
eukprot:TRINITY_DN26175_c0_g1_i1.p1 TRINITY_DN26175_c0_g1~~TRINITY_DN26175_c0_g1_i1.p1  ORF type:complete len:602 (-),score=146.86 TRINITY_DN26175_c0_g1_i1:174-1979(-)